jgi:hypothetical protein
MASTKPSIERLRKIMERQSIAAWGADYQPSNYTTIREAPGKSRPSRLTCGKLDGRELQTQSKPERAAALLALYHPNVFDLHEQKVLFVAPRLHPLVGHPCAIGLNLPSLQGTVAVADRMGILARHPIVRMPSMTAIGEFMWVPFPFVGDLLLFIHDRHGPFCINWTVKKDEESFKFSMPGIRPSLLQRVPESSVIQRHEIEKFYYSDADIPTYQITENNIDQEVRINLLNLFYWHARPIRAAPEVVELILKDFERGIGTDMLAFELVKRVMRDHRVNQETAKTILKKGIWSRRLRVDLFQPILDNYPLRIESRDVIDVYSAWFSRLAP